MQLPFRVVLHRPHRAAISRWVRKWRWWVATVCVILNTAAAFVNHQLVQRAEEAHGGMLVISTSPAGAFVEVDDRTRGETPATIPLSAKPHRVTLRRDGYAPVTHDVAVTAAQTVTLQADLWLASPRVERLRPTFPGAEITNAFFLADGRVALALALQPGDERQLWVLENGGGARRVGPPNVHGSLAVSPDGRVVAYLARGQGGTAMGNRLDEVWLIAGEGQRGVRAYALPENTPDESLVDLAWTPDGRGLLVAARQSVMGLGGRTLLRRLDTATLETRDLVSLPSEVVAGSYLWSPDGIHVAFLSRAEQTTSLCILNIQTGEFRYLADVSWDSAAPLPFPPLAWSPDGQRLLYSAPAQDRSTQANWFFATRPAMAVFETTLTTRSGQRIGDAEAQSPILRPDGVILALARVGDFITQTPPSGSYASPTVQGLWGVVRLIANAALVLVVLWGGFNVMLRQQLGSPYHDAMELFPRIIVGALLANMSLSWTQLAIDANNALCSAVGQATLPAWERADIGSQVLADLVAALIYLVTSLVLLLQALMRLALVDVLLVVSPLALLCWVLPQTQGWARLS